MEIYTGESVKKLKTKKESVRPRPFYSVQPTFRAPLKVRDARLATLPKP